MTRGRAFRGAIFGLVWVGVWASPACKTNEVNQSSNTTNNITYTTVGPNGATVPGPDGTKIRIPAGALDEDTDIAIVEAKPGEYPDTMIPSVPPTPLAVQGKVWAFLPHGLTFFVDPTFTVPAPAGDWGIWKSQPGGQWMQVASGTSTGGTMQFKSSTFSFYVVAQGAPGGTVDAGGRDATAPPDDSGSTTGDGGGGGFDSGKMDPPDVSVGDSGSDPCKACVDNCGVKCGSNAICRNNCISTECGSVCGTGSDASTGADTSGGGTPVCNDGVVTAPETCDDGNTIGGDGCSSTCQVEAGWSCPSTGGICTPTSTCPTKTQTSSGSGTFSSYTVADGYAFYKPDNMIGSDYYSQLWIVLSDKPGACTRSLSHQNAPSNNTLRIRIEATKTASPFVFAPGTYSAGSTYSVSGSTESWSPSCAASTPTPFGNPGTVTITSTAGGRYAGTYSFPAGTFPAASGSFDLPTCAEDNSLGPVPPECCK